MIFSFNQIEQTARKAARGAGLAWGLAEDVGRAVRWLHAYQFNGAAALAELLTAMQGAAPASLGANWRAPDGKMLDPLRCGAAFCDGFMQLHSSPITTGAMARPLLAAGFTGLLAESENIGIIIKWRGVAVHCRRGRAGFDGAARELDCAMSQSVQWQFAAADNAPGEWRYARAGGAAIAPRSWQCLEHYARATYVATSDVSRAAAGAGLRDND